MAKLREKALVTCSHSCAYNDPIRIYNNSEAQKGRKGSFRGRQHSEASKARMRLSKVDKVGNRKGSTHTDATKQKISKAVRSRLQSDPEKYKAGCRKGYMRKVAQGYAVTGHNYNLESLFFLQEIDSMIPFSCNYAPKEKAIRVTATHCRYADFYCEDLKLIIEWDEESHFSKQHIRDDKHREKQILHALGDDWKIIRIREKEYTGYDKYKRNQYIKGVIDRRSAEVQSCLYDLRSIAYEPTNCRT